jgi:hypothetical protein
MEVAERDAEAKTSDLLYILQYWNISASTVANLFCRKNLLRFRPGAPDAMEMGIRIQQYKSS